MSVKSRQAENSAATRTALLRVARRLFATRGYADTATEEVVRRARVTRGALYHHFKDKRDLFEAVLDEEQIKIADLVAKAAATQSDPWSALLVGSKAFLEACLDPAVQQIILIDAPAVLGWKKWRENDQSHYLEGLKAAIALSIEEGLIARQPTEPLAHVIMGAMNEAALLIAHADDEQAARREVTTVIERLFAGIRGA
ncbi:MAG: helix-turn-helix domain-containing protein [Candidatus Binataceae bacterium]